MASESEIFKFRLALALLIGLIGVLSLIGILILALYGQRVPDILVASASASVASLGTAFSHAVITRNGAPPGPH